MLQRNHRYASYKSCLIAAVNGVVVDQTEGTMDTLEISALVVFAPSVLWMHPWVILEKGSRENLSRICLLDGLALLIVVISWTRGIIPIGYFTKGRRTS